MRRNPSQGSQCEQGTKSTHPENVSWRFYRPRGSIVDLGRQMLDTGEPMYYDYLRIGPLMCVPFRVVSLTGRAALFCVIVIF